MRYLVDIDAGWLTMPRFVGILIIVAFVALGVYLWNSLNLPDEDDDSFFE